MGEQGKGGEIAKIKEEDLNKDWARIFEILDEFWLLIGNNFPDDENEIWTTIILQRSNRKKSKEVVNDCNEKRKNGS